MSAPRSSARLERDRNHRSHHIHSQPLVFSEPSAARQAYYASPVHSPSLSCVMISHLPLFLQTPTLPYGFLFSAEALASYSPKKTGATEEDFPSLSSTAPARPHLCPSMASLALLWMGRLNPAPPLEPGAHPWPLPQGLTPESPALSSVLSVLPLLSRIISIQTSYNFFHQTRHKETKTKTLRSYVDSSADAYFSAFLYGKP